MRSRLPRYVERLNKKHAVVMMSGRCVILNEEVHPTRKRKEISLSSPTDFHHRYSNRKIQIPNTDKPVPETRLWLGHRHSVNWNQPMSKF